MTVRRLAEPLRWRRNLGDEVAHQRLVRQRLHYHLAWLQPRRAGIGGGAVDLHHAFLAGIGVDAGEPYRQRRVVVRPDPAQAVENRLARLERHLIGLELPGLRRESAPDPQSRSYGHCAATHSCAGIIQTNSIAPSRQRATWLPRHSSSMAGKSSRW